MTLTLGSREYQEFKQLGRDDPFDPFTDLQDYLRGPFRKGYGLTTRRPAKVGRELSERAVSHLEVLSAISSLPNRQRLIMEELYVRDRPIDEVADLVGLGRTQVYAERRAALKAMVAVIYDRTN